MGAVVVLGAGHCASWTGSRWIFLALEKKGTARCAICKLKGDLVDGGLREVSMGQFCFGRTPSLEIHGAMCQKARQLERWLGAVARATHPQSPTGVVPSGQRTALTAVLWCSVSILLCGLRAPGASIRITKHHNVSTLNGEPSCTAINASQAFF